MLVNTLGHTGQAISFRCYNPGLITSLLLFVPLGMATVILVPGTIVQHVLGLAIAIGIHLSIGVSVTLHSKRLALKGY